MEQNILLLQSSMEISSRTAARQGDVYDYIQQLIDERAASEAYRMVEQGDVDAGAWAGTDFDGASLVGRHGVLTYNASSAADFSGVSTNGVGDLKILVNAFAINGVVIAACLAFFGFGKMFSPMVYAFRDVDGRSDGFFGWARASLRLSFEDIVVAAGLEYALMIEFTYMAMKILLVLGIPFLAILSPLDWCCGGNAAGEDHLSWMGLANVEIGSWVCWVQFPAVWWTVAVTQFFIFRTMNRVLVPRRTEWLLSMPRLRATTVLVSNIPDDRNSAQGIKNYFDELVFGRKVVKQVEVVKDVRDLTPLMNEREQLYHSLHRLRQDKNEAENVRQLAEVEDKIARYTAQVERDDALNCSFAFVTFFYRREATIASKLLSPDDEEELEVTAAPDVIDVLWADLLKDPNANNIREIIGYLLIIAVFFLFLPTVAGLSAITNLNTLKEWSPAIRDIVAQYPIIGTLWESAVSAAALTIVMGFVPLILCLISNSFFNLKAESVLQHYLQTYSYWFQVVFVLLVTAIGSSLVTTSQQLIRSPMSVFSLLAETMPVSTHFYMNYFVIQWTTHFINLTRYVNAGKFFVYSRMYESLEAKELAEPEDHADYGIGARAARWALLLVTALVFGTLSPLMTLFGLVNFVIARIVYGYLVVFAETRKPDLGGLVFVTACKQTQQGLFIYAALMTGVLLQRAASVVPGILSACVFLPLIYTYQQFKKFRWEFLEFGDVQEYDGKVRKGQVPEVAGIGTAEEGPSSYKQPELSLVEAPEEPQPGCFGQSSRSRNGSRSKS